MSANARIFDLTRRARTPLVLVVVYAIGVHEAWDPSIRFELQLANSIALTVLQIIPVILLGLSVSRGRWWGRMLRAIVLLPIVAIAAIIGSCAVLEGGFIVMHGRSASFERIDSVPLEQGMLTAYRTNGGATTPFGVVVRQECRLLPGILRVRSVWSASPADEVSIQVLTEDRVHFATPPYGDRRWTASSEVVELKPLWCPAFGGTGRSIRSSRDAVMEARDES